MDLFDLKRTDSNAYNYIVSAQKPTVVNAAVVGNFRNQNELDMIISRVNRIEHFLITEEGLKPNKEIPIYGRIATLNSFRLPNENLDSILVLTVKYHLAILSFNAAGEVRTRAFGCVADRVGRAAETGIIASVHSTGLIVLRLYEGFLKIIKWEDNQELHIFNVRFDDHNVTDFDFLDNEKPTIAYFYEDLYGKHLKICQIDIDEKEMLSPLWRQGNIEAEATLLIPIPKPYGGLVVVGQDSISYQRDANYYTAIAPPLIHMALFNCYARVEKNGKRFLLGDVSGRLFMLLLITGISKDGLPEVKDIKVELLGDVSIPECLVYLDNSVVFVGSRYGDSQLIKLTTEPTESNSFIIVLDTLPNLGPIRDFVIMNNDNQSQMITCSGAFKNGSLRIVRCGIGIDVIASVELPNIKNLFTLKLNSKLDKYLVVSLREVTHLLLLDGEELEDTQMDDFELQKTTLFAGNIAPNRILQITPDDMRLISGDGTFKTKWVSPTKITRCSVNVHGSQIILGSGSNLYYFKAEADELKLMLQYTFDNEISCLDISPTEDNEASKMFAVGFWNTNTVALYTVNPEINLIVKEKVDNDVLPRSVLIISMEGLLYLLVALGDGTIYYYKIDSKTGELTHSKKVSLGTQPTTLKKFISKDSSNVFSCSDRPAVIYSSNQKLAFSNVNMKMVTQMTQLDSDFYKNCLVISDSENLTIGTIDEIQKLHIRTVPLGESVSRIAYQRETNTIAILTSRIENVSVKDINHSRCPESISTMCSQKSSTLVSDRNHITMPSNRNEDDSVESFLKRNNEQSEENEIEIHSICFLDANTFVCQYVYELSYYEHGLSLCSTFLSNDAIPYFVVGTAFVHTDDAEAKQGQILVFQVQNSNQSELCKVQLITEKEVKGAVYSLAPLSQKIICTINSSVRLFEWTAEKELRLECSHFNYITALYVKTKGDLIIVGDLMRSICLLCYKQIDSSFEEIARDYAVEWMTACEIIDSDTFIGAENHHNIFCVQKDVNAETDEDRMRLKQIGFYYLGEMINVFRRGTIISNEPEISVQHFAQSNPIMFGTADGGLGLVVQLPEKDYKFLYELQKRIADQTHNCMRVSHEDYRNFTTEKRTEKCQGFIDGDLIESLCDMPIDTVKNIVKGINLPSITDPLRHTTSAHDVLKYIEDLSRIH